MRRGRTPAGPRRSGRCRTRRSRAPGRRARCSRHLRERCPRRKHAPPGALRRAAPREAGTRHGGRAGAAEVGPRTQLKRTAHSVRLARLVQLVRLVQLLHSAQQDLPTAGPPAGEWWRAPLTKRVRRRAASPDESSRSRTDQGLRAPQRAPTVYRRARCASGSRSRRRSRGSGELRLAAWAWTRRVGPAPDVCRIDGVVAERPRKGPSYAPF